MDSREGEVRRLFNALTRGQKAKFLLDLIGPKACALIIADKIPDRTSEASIEERD